MHPLQGVQRCGVTLFFAAWGTWNWTSGPWFPPRARNPANPAARNDVHFLRGLTGRAAVWHTQKGEEKAKPGLMIATLARKTELMAALQGRWGASVAYLRRPAPELVPTGFPEVDTLTGGLPRGALTEIVGPASSGRTSLLMATLAEATRRQEICAVVDSSDTFDPAAAAACGVDLTRLLWVRCGGHPEHALRAADLLVQGGGFGCVALDLGDIPAPVARRIPLACWFRLRRAVENTPTVLLALEPVSCAPSCASLILEMKLERPNWSGTPDCSRLLTGARFEVCPRKPAASAPAAFQVQALG